MFSKQQREVLGSISSTIWGAETRWKKLYDSGALDVLVSETEVDEAVDQIQLSNSKKTRRGTIYNLATAPKKILASVQDLTETVKVKKQERRKPDFDEVVASLTDLARATLYSYLKPEQLVNVFAVDFTSGEKIELKLVKKEDEQYNKDFADLVAKLPEEIKTKVETFNEGIPVDAVEFVSEVLFVRNHKDHAMELYNNNLQIATVLHKQAARKAAFKQRMGL